MNVAQKHEYIQASPDCRLTKDFIFESYAQSREEAGLSGDLMIATNKTVSDERYIIKHSNASDPANEFAYYKIAAAMGALMPEIKLFEAFGDMNAPKFKSRYICGSQFIERQADIVFDDMLAKAVNPQNCFYHCALGTLFDQDDKLQFMLDKDNRLYHYDAAQTFNVDDYTMTGFINVPQNNPMWDVLFANQFKKAGSGYWATILANTEWVEGLRKEHGDKCIPHLLHPLYEIQKISDSYIDSIMETLSCFYPDRISDYYKRFIHNAQQAAREALAVLESKYAEMLK